MDWILSLMLSLLVLPGILYTILMSLWLSGIDRKLVARMQRRVGPPILQPWYDYLKCCGKETLIPRKADKKLFLAMPVLGLAIVLTAAMFIPVGGLQAISAGADTIVILYLLSFASVTLIVGASASGSPFAGVGLSREMVSMISYELPFVLVLLSVGRLAGEGTPLGITFSLQRIADWQAENGLLIRHFAMIPAAIAMLFVIPCEVGAHPFDIDEAETEICEGVLAEYSGKPLAQFKMMHYIKGYVMSALFCALFLCFQTGNIALDVLLHIVSCTVVTFVSMSIPHAIAARFRVEQVFYFYWTVVSGLAILSLLLVWFGV